MATDENQKQLLHLVFGGELTSLERHEFKDLSGLDIVGVFPNYVAAHTAWKAKAQATVDFGSGGTKRLVLRYAPLTKL